jgi:hypothetical protein
VDAAMNWRDDLYKTWLAASITWAIALHLMIAIERPDWSAVFGSDTYWLFLVMPPFGMALLMLGNTIPEVAEVTPWRRRNLRAPDSSSPG